ncbi:hypothetical protein [Burkholderia mayonis]|nr:hypothetical protein [Burkholderia mayonis]
MSTIRQGAEKHIIDIAGSSPTATGHSIRTLLSALAPCFFGNDPEILVHRDDGAVGAIARVPNEYMDLASAHEHHPLFVMEASTPTRVRREVVEKALRQACRAAPR